MANLLRAIRRALPGGRARRDYAGAAKGRHVDGWKVGSTSADTEIYSGGRRLRDRSRDLVRNNPHAAKAISIFATNIVGDGIMPRPSTGSDAKDLKVKAAFERWCKECDADGQLDFYGLQTLAVREMAEGGEILGRRRWRRQSDGYHVPLQIQLLESDFLADWRHGLLPNGGRTIQGVELSPIGQRAAYWLYNDHPGNNFIINAGYTANRVPANDIVHLYEKQRTQARGVPWTAPVIRRIRDADDWNFAEGIRKKIEASAVAVVTSDNEFEEPLANTDGGPRVTDWAGNIIERISPGLIAYLRGGKDIKFNAPATVGGYEEYNRVSARDVASGMRVPYEFLTGDLSSVNFSSARVGIVEFRRFCSQVQWQIVVPMFLDPIWKWFCEAAFLAGQIDDIDVPVNWAMPKWPAIDPYKDALADLIVLRTGTRSWPDVVSESGRNPEDVFAEIDRWNKRFDDAGIVLDIDPRKVSRAGVTQARAGQPVLPDPDMPDPDAKPTD